MPLCKYNSTIDHTAIPVSYARFVVFTTNKKKENSLVGLSGSLASFLWQLLAKRSSPRNQSKLCM